MHLPAKLAPYKAAVFPLLKNKPELVEKAREIYKDLQKHFNVAWDDRGMWEKDITARTKSARLYALL